MRFAVLIWVLLAAAPPPASGQVFFLSHVDTVLTVPPGSCAVPLSDSLIAAGSDSAVLNGTPLVRRRDYLFDYDRGIITLRSAYAETVSLAVGYDRVPLFSRRRFAHRALVRSAPGDSAPAPVPVAVPLYDRAYDDENDLVLYGSKTFGVSMGSRSGLAVEQALNLNIRGTVARDVHITASLSDQSTPIPPEGDTRTLRELDGVKIKAEGKNVSVEMGNLDVLYEGSEFGNYRKRLDGARAALALRSAGLDICVALTGGQFATAALAGTDGKQGPYSLPGTYGESGFNVLPGTEKIWVDGEAMIRGRENDYVIDYGDGSITFTNRRLITGESRITADYEYAQGNYHRSFYSGGGHLEFLDGRVGLTAAVVYEGDDGSAPLDVGSLDDSARAVLAAAGDDPLAAIDMSGAIRADSLGMYYLRGDTLIDTVAGYGTHSAAFTYVGGGKGDYVYLLGQGRYRFVGRGQGTHLPVILLPLPQSRLLADLRAVLRPLPSVTVTGELALTEEDKNTLSTVDDRDNAGHALQVKAVIAPDSLRIGSRYAGRMRVDGGYRRTSARFAPPGRATGVEEFTREWNLIPDPGQTIEMLDGAAEYRYRNMVTAGGELGQLGQSDAGTHMRRKGYVRAGMPKLPELQLDWQDAGSGAGDGSYWERHTGAVSYPLGVAVPEGSYEREYYSAGTARTFDNTTARQYGITGFTAGLRSRGAAGGTLAGAATYGERDGEMAYAPYFEARTLQVEGALRDWRSMAGQLAFTRRDKIRHTDEGDEENRTYLATAKAEAAPFNRAVTVDVRYDVTSTQNARRQEVFRRVDTYGEYRFDVDPFSGDTLWTADADGEYVREFIPVGEYRPSVEAKGSAALSLAPRRWAGLSKTKAGTFLRAFSAATRYTFGQASLTERAGVDVFLPVSGTIDTSLTLRREQTLRQDITWDPASSFSLRFRYRLGMTDDWEDYVDGFVRHEDERGLRLRTGRSTAFSNETELILRSEQEERGTGQSDIRSRDLKSTFFRKFSARSEGSMGVQYRRDDEQLSGLTSSMYAFKPSLRYSLGRTGRLTLDMEAVNVTDSTASYRQLAGNRQGWSYRLNLLFDYRVNKFVTYYVTYSLADEPYIDDRRRVTQQGRAEVRASF